MPIIGYSRALGWTPLRLSPAGWWKADAAAYNDAGTTLATDGQTVQQWNDQSGNGLTLSQATSGERPIWRATGYNGKPGIEFRSASSQWLKTAAAALALGTDEITVWVVMNHANISDTGEARLITFVATGQAADYDNLGSFLWQHNAIETQQIFRQGSSRASLVAGGMPHSTDEAMLFEASSAGHSIYKNNVSLVGPSSALGNFGATGVLTVGGSEHTADGWLNATIAEVGVVARILTAAERGSLQAYIEDKWLRTHFGNPNFSSAAPLDIILDSDLFPDVDDAAAFGIAIQAHLDGDVNILGVVVSSTGVSAAPCARAILDHYGLTNVPVGAYQGDQGIYTEAYTDAVRDRFGTSGQKRTAYMNDVRLYRTLIAQNSRNVTIVAIGGLTSLSRFRQSGADSISSLTGQQLATNKVTQVVAMGGDYPSGTAEFNLSRVPAASADIGDSWPTPIIWHGFSVGVSVNCGPPTSVSEFDDPIRHAFVEFGVDQQSSWDPLAVHYAIYGPRSAWDLGGEDGTNTIDNATGDNDWTATAGNDSYVTKISSDATLGGELDAILATLTA